MKDTETFRDRLLREIEASNQNLAELARASGVSYSVLTKLKRGDVTTTSAENAEKLQRYFNLTDKDIAGFAEPQAQPRLDVLGRLDSAAPHPTDADRITGGANETIKIATAGNTIQVFATVTVDNFDELIRRLKIARQMIADEPS